MTIQSLKHSAANINLSDLLDMVDHRLGKAKSMLIMMTSEQFMDASRLESQDYISLLDDQIQWVIDILMEYQQQPYITPPPCTLN